jgi:hypothetical protein
MKQLFPLLFAAAIGSAATYFVMEARQPKPKAPVEAVAEKAATPKAAAKSSTSGAEADSAEDARKAGGSKFAGKGGFLPDEIDGVTPEQLNKCKATFFKVFQDEGVKAVRAKQAELRKEAEYASDDEKRNLRTQFEDLQVELRKASKEAMLAADADLTEDIVDKVLDAVEERMRSRAQQFQQNGKKK